jgi:hypothetical protein
VENCFVDGAASARASVSGVARFAEAHGGICGEPDSVVEPEELADGRARLTERISGSTMRASETSFGCALADDVFFLEASGITSGQSGRGLEKSGAN